jgi:hypothetical protein
LRYTCIFDMKSMTLRISGKKEIWITADGI